MKVILVIAAVLLITGCKKEKAKSFSELFKNTVWSGEYKESSRPFADPFSIQFSDNGTFKWYDIHGKYDGNVSVDEANRKITIAFVGQQPITITIEDDDHFGNILYSVPLTWAFHNGFRVDNPDRSLDNTRWEGKVSFISSAPPLEMNFLPGEEMTYAMSGNPPTPPISYMRAGGALYFNFTADAFGIIKGDSIKGLIWSGIEYRPWAVGRKK
jgi:hypothetical protein